MHWDELSALCMCLVIQFMMINDLQYKIPQYMKRVFIFLFYTMTTKNSHTTYLRHSLMHATIKLVSPWHDT